MAEPEAKIVPPPAPVEVPLQFYVNQTNTYLGKSLMQELTTPIVPIVAPPPTSVTEKVQHKFFTSDSAAGIAGQKDIAGTWKVCDYQIQYRHRKKPQLAFAKNSRVAM